MLMLIGFISANVTLLTGSVIAAILAAADVNIRIDGRRSRTAERRFRLACIVVSAISGGMPIAAALTVAVSWAFHS